MSRLEELAEVRTPLEFLEGLTDNEVDDLLVDLLVTDDVTLLRKHPRMDLWVKVISAEHKKRNEIKELS